MYWLNTIFCCGKKQCLSITLWSLRIDYLARGFTSLLDTEGMKLVSMSILSSSISSFIIFPGIFQCIWKHLSASLFTHGAVSIDMALGTYVLVRTTRSYSVLTILFKHTAHIWKTWEWILWSKNYLCAWLINS